ncbi:aromatic amino acid transporter AroP [Escherichia coli]|uniref:aromatic amino acid transporter AroP n=1 Tax=Escherichia coli TaxID=562 RepID=UPI0013EBEA89|nr:aromatic amino acid transporter AroP [Escherichia coli]EGO5043647.1 aromatic amino acid transporter AroP [Escherichia coli]EGP9748144.1 aromatic amino acid transporter AroP [Escherichia coli]EHC4959246.1 aromatic amino acid transporter AroP [Escherichia coli]EHH5084354.1 aromatic amino acid transporter AroP [Escherichia coli]EHK1630742.1 aromatic amino acid transporter AroP [Escherichia coli]
MMEGQQHGEQLKRGLKNRHIQLIALGGAIGTGLFLGSASVIQSAGPGIILGYAIAGFIAFLIMRQLGEMVVEEPVAGSFSHFAYKYWGSFAGFASGWNYWVLYVLVAMAELTAVGKYIQFWYPEIPTWVSAAVFFVVINAINLTNVKVFGEMEFWFAIIKVIAVVAMIIFGGWLLFSGNGGPQASVSNLWDQGGFLPHGFTGLVMMMAIIMFSFGGLELVGITAAEADNPEQSIPKATNQVIYRILIFYIGSLAVLLSLMPWTRVTADTSPFVLIFHELGDTFVANALNIVVLTAALSVYNSCVYCNSRMLFGLAQQGNAPKALASVDKRGVPVNTILVSALVTALCVLINYLAPESAFGLLMALVVSALVINWAMISLAHMKFRRAKQEQGVVTRFPALLYPLGNWICLLFMAAVLVIMLMTPGMAISVYLIPVWLIVLVIGYLFKEKTAKAVKAH